MRVGRIGLVTAGLSAVGAVVGAVLAPVVTWALLRRVPLGRVLAHTALGAAGARCAASCWTRRGRRCGRSSAFWGRWAGSQCSPAGTRRPVGIPTPPPNEALQPSGARAKEASG